MKRLFIYISILALGLMAHANLAIGQIIPTPDLMLLGPTPLVTTVVVNQPSVVVFRFNHDNLSVVVVDPTGTESVLGTFMNSAPDNAGYSFGLQGWTPVSTGVYHLKLVVGSTVVTSPNITVITVGNSPNPLPQLLSFSATSVSGELETGQQVTMVVGFTAGATITAMLDGVSVTPSTSGAGTATYVSTFTTAVSHTLVVTVTNANGSATGSYSVPIVTPDTPPTNPPPHIDNWTVSEAVVGQPFTVKVDWTATVGATFVGKFDGVVITPTSISAGTATFSVATSVEGTHTFAGVVTDTNGSASSANNFNVDAPGTTPTPDPPAIVIWTVGESVVNQPIIIRADWTGAPGATFVGKFDGVVITPTSISAGTATFSVATSVEGTHTFAGVVTDANGSANSATNFNVATPGETPPVTVVTGVTNISMSEFIRVDQEFTLMFNFAPIGAPVTVVMVDASGGRTYMTLTSNEGGVASFTGIFRVAGTSKLIITVDGLAPFTILVNVEHPWMIMFKADPTGMLFSVHPDEIISSNPRRSPYIGVKMERVDAPPPDGPLPVKSSFSNGWIRGTVKQGLHKTVGAFALEAYPDR